MHPARFRHRLDVSDGFGIVGGSEAVPLIEGFGLEAVEQEPLFTLNRD